MQHNPPIYPINTKQQSPNINTAGTGLGSFVNVNVNASGVGFSKSQVCQMTASLLLFLSCENEL